MHLGRCDFVFLYCAAVGKKLDSLTVSVFKPDNQWIGRAAFGLTCALVIVVFCRSAEPGFFEVNNLRAGDSYYNLLVQGFRSGQLNVKREAPPELAGLANPYDPVVNTPFVWDTRHLSYEMSYYKGKLYLYYGVTPALVLFWPYAALTGQFCTHKDAVVIFFTVGFLVSAWLIYAAWRRYFAGTSIWLVAAGSLALGLATGFLEPLSNCDLHEVPHSCGFAFTMLALAAIWNALHRPKQQILWLTLGSLAYGLAVGARPSLLFGIVILLIPVLHAGRTAIAPVSIKRKSCLLIAAVGPAMLIGLGLAIYNAWRFDSPFEFGWRYQLTDIQNNLAQPFGLHYLWFNFKFYFLEMIQWRTHFPFLQADVSSSLPSNYYAVGGPYCGILLNCPLVWFALAAPLAWRGRIMTAASPLRWFLSATFLLFAINALTLCCFFSGSSGYLSDFLPALLLLAVVGVWSLERALKDFPFWFWFVRLIWCVLLVYSLVFSLLVGIKTHAYAHYIVGNSLAHQGRDAEAVEHYEKSLKLDPGSLPLNIGLGNAFTKQGKMMEGIFHYQKTLEIDPHNVEALYDLSLTLIQVGRVDEASVHFQKVVELNPGYFESQNPGINNNLAWSLATNPEPTKRNGKMAVILAEAACRNTRYQTTMMVGTLAATYAEAGRFNDAITAAQKTCALAAQSGDEKLLQNNRDLLALYLRHEAYHENLAR